MGGSIDKWVKVCIASTKEVFSEAEGCGEGEEPAIFSRDSFDDEADSPS